MIRGNHAVLDFFSKKIQNDVLNLYLPNGNIANSVMTLLTSDIDGIGSMFA